MKIAIVVGAFPVVSQTFIVNQINALLDLGHQVQVFSYKKTKDPVVHKSLHTHHLLENVVYFEKAPKSKIKRVISFIKWVLAHFNNIQWMHFFKTLNVFKYGKQVLTLHLFFEAQWFLKSKDFDIVHVHFGPYASRIAYLKANNILPNNTKFVATFHGYDLEPDKLSQYKLSYKYLLKQANTFTVNTPYLLGLLKQVNIDKKPIHILPVGLDTYFFKRNKTKKKSNYFEIVFCGRLIAFKAPDIAVLILYALHKKGYHHVRLHIIGTGPMFKQLENQVETLELKNSILFYGSQNQDVIRHRFEQSDIFLLPGIHDPKTGRAETQGLVIQEAQAMELPVVVSDAGGMKYGLLPNESGFVVEEGNIEGFVTVIEQLILNPDRKIDMGRKGIEIAKTYDNKILIEKLLGIYENMN